MTKNYSNILFFFLFLLFAAQVQAAPVEERKNYFYAGMGFAGSDEQHDVMVETYSDRNPSGSGNMLNMELGYSFDLVKGLSISPKLHMLAYRAKFQSVFSPTGNYKSNLYVIPTVALRYDIGNYQSSFYVQAQVGSNSASSDFARVDNVDADGMVKGVAVGFRHTRFHFEFGTIQMPVTIQTDSFTNGVSGDFGGTYFMFKVGHR